jgi:hypothetical protein
MKNITKICDFNIKELFLQKDKNNREIYIYNLENFKFVKGYNFYPNVLLTNNEIVINPIEEITMSLKEISDNNQIYFDEIKSTNRVSNPVFYFIYNTDNYFHFIYDSLPYLISFFEIKKKYPDLKLLMNYPNYQKTEFYQFTIEFLELIVFYINGCLYVNRILNASFRLNSLIFSNSNFSFSIVLSDINNFLRNCEKLETL